MKTINKEPRGTLVWQMHASSEISSVVFVDRKVVGMLSAYYPLIPSSDEAWPTVPCQIEGVLIDVETSSIHQAYTKYMLEVNVADHLQSSYTC